ncbi:MAG: DUF5320 domain-containing protein [Bacteroidales bacterium]|nr:DUF5320 domain-containing protein [Bacteroidales bacterium]
MPHLNGTGPEGKGPKTGRGLGDCKDQSDAAKKTELGKGLGKRRKSGGGEGRGERLKYND